MAVTGTSACSTVSAMTSTGPFSGAFGGSRPQLVRISTHAINAARANSRANEAFMATNPRQRETSARNCGAAGQCKRRVLRSFTADRGVCRLLRFPRDRGRFVEAAAEGEVQVDALDQTFDLHPHERYLRGVQRKLLLLDATQIA